VGDDLVSVTTPSMKSLDNDDDDDDDDDDERFGNDWVLSIQLSSFRRLV
jgi:hypothetical protein